MMHFRLLSALALLAVTMGGASVSALAADPVFPPGARIGMTPLVGLVPAKAFTGFETEDQSVKVLIAELPVAAYGEVTNAFKTNPAIAAGAKPETLETGAGTAYYTVETAKNASGTFRHYAMILSGGAFSGYVDVQVPENATKIYSDDAVRQMFVSAVIRKEVPVAEQLALMPFKVGDLGNFKNVRALGGDRRPAARRRRRDRRLRGRALHGDRPGRGDPDAARRSRPFCRTGRAVHSRNAQRTDYDVRACPHRWHGRV